MFPVVQLVPRFGWPYSAGFLAPGAVLAAAALPWLAAVEAGLHRVSGGSMTLVVLAGLGCMASRMRWAMASRSSASKS